MQPGRQLVSVLALACLAVAARGAEPQPDLVTKSRTQATPAPPDPVRGAPQAAGPVSATGVDERPRRGTFAEVTLGVFTTMGGSRFMSNGQPYLGLMVGREVGEAASIFGALGIGASSASCFDLGSTGNCKAADSFGATYLEVGASYGAQLGSRVLLSGKIVAGLTNLSPAPVTDSPTSNVVSDNLFGFHGGVGLSLDYATRLDHFLVGLDALARYTLAQRPGGGGSANVASLSVMPRLRYVF